MGDDPSAMDPRPLPPGWMTQWNERYRTWFYINTNVDPPASVWEHPSDTTEVRLVRLRSELQLARGSVSANDDARAAARRRDDYDVDNLALLSGLGDVAGNLPLLDFEHHPSTLDTHPQPIKMPSEPGAVTGGHLCYVLDYPSLYELSPHQLGRLQTQVASYHQQQQPPHRHGLDFLPTSMPGSSPATTAAIMMHVPPPSNLTHAAQAGLPATLGFQPRAQQHHPLGEGSMVSIHPSEEMVPTYGFNETHLRHHHGPLNGHCVNVEVPRTFGTLSGGAD